jgi:MOSC domain-containing protein YiiM
MCTGGRVVAIYTAGQAGSPMRPHQDVRAVPGQGLEGDRYFAGHGMFSSRDVPGREVTELTLIEREVIEHLREDWDLDVVDSDSRRNLVTAGVALNELVGREFYVGGVRLRGAGLCEPCVSLVKSPANRHLLRALAHKGGLRAQILTEGSIAVGDRIDDYTPAWEGSAAGPIG